MCNKFIFSVYSNRVYFISKKTRGSRRSPVNRVSLLPTDRHNSDARVVRGYLMSSHLVMTSTVEQRPRIERLSVVHTRTGGPLAVVCVCGPPSDPADSFRHSSANYKQFVLAPHAPRANLYLPQLLVLLKKNNILEGGIG